MEDRKAKQKQTSKYSPLRRLHCKVDRARRAQRDNKRMLRCAWRAKHIAFRAETLGHIPGVNVVLVECGTRLTSSYHHPCGSVFPRPSVELSRWLGQHSLREAAEGNLRPNTPRLECSVIRDCKNHRKRMIESGDSLQVPDKVE